MARISRSVLVLSSQTVTSSGTITSGTIDISRAAFAGLHYLLSTATTGLYVAATAQVILSAHTDQTTFLTPVNDIGTSVGDLGQIDSNNRFIQVSIPHAKYAQLVVNSITNNSITFDGIYVVLDEHN